MNEENEAWDVKAKRRSRIVKQTVDAREQNTAERAVGDLSGEGPPGSISNPEVKLTSADGTARATVWESTPLPTLFLPLLTRGRCTTRQTNTT